MTTDRVKTGTDAPLPGLDRGELLGAVRRALGSSGAELLEWQASRLGYDCTSPVSSGLFRVRGTARDEGRIVPWSMVLKVACTPVGTIFPDGRSISPATVEAPTSCGYWRREALVYESRLLEELPGPLVAPRCYGVSAPRDGVMHIWLEEVADMSGPRWDLDRYALAAHHLGQFNGSYLVGRPLPDYPFLGGGWLRSWVEGPAARMVETVRDVTRWEHPLLRRSLPRSTYGRLFRLWEKRSVLLRILEDLPVTFCHRDAFRSNLLARFGPDGQGETVAIDWAFAGIGPIGEEIAPLIAMRPVGGAEEFEPWDLEAAVFDGYMQGLQEAGWAGGRPGVRFGYTASSALRYLVPTVMGLLRDAQDEGRYPAVEERRGKPIGQIVERQAALISFLLERADEARRLMPSLDQATTAARGWHKAELVHHPEVVAHRNVLDCQTVPKVKEVHLPDSEASACFRLLRRMND